MHYERTAVYGENTTATVSSDLDLNSLASYCLEKIITYIYYV